MDAHHVIYLGSKKEIIDLTILKKLLKEKINQQKYQHPGSDPTIVLSIDKNVSYDAFLKLFSIVQQCGQRVRLVYKTSNDSN